MLRYFSLNLSGVFAVKILSQKISGFELINESFLRKALYCVMVFIS